MQRHFPEPDHIGAEHSGRLAAITGLAGGDITGPAAPLMAACTEDTEQFAMHMQQIPRAGPIVQIINILGHQRDAVWPMLLQSGEGKVGGIGRNTGLLKLPAPLVIEALHQRGIAGEGLRCGDILKPVVLPKAVGATKGADAGFRRNTRTCENDNIHLDPRFLILHAVQAIMPP